VDVVEFSYYGTPAIAPKEQVYTELVEGLRGNDAIIGPGSQVAYILIEISISVKCGLNHVRKSEVRRVKPC
jgi:hypothetical protein